MEQVSDKKKTFSLVHIHQVFTSSNCVSLSNHRQGDLFGAYNDNVFLSDYAFHLWWVPDIWVDIWVDILVVSRGPLYSRKNIDLALENYVLRSR